MKILFFTPALISSAIGRVSSLVVHQLLKMGHDVVVVRAEDPLFFKNPIHPFSCKVVLWNKKEKIRHLAAKSDLVVYQIGDHCPYHRGCLEWLPVLPGIVSMHDIFVGNLFWGWSGEIGRAQAIEQVCSLYGTEVAQRFFEHDNIVSFIAYASEAAPMTEWIASMASAVIVHSSWAINRIVSTCIGPVEVVPLPYDAPYLEVTEGIEKAADGRVIALTIGQVNYNKRYTSIIKAIGMNPLLRARLTYRIVGAINPVMEKDLQTLADELDVSIVITGAVDNQTLADEIQRADVMCCLRWPALEAASASTIEAMLYSKPAIVINTGFYRDLPDSCVVKISIEPEVIELQRALLRLVNSPDERLAIGKRAAQYARETFRADQYAERLVAMKQRIDRSNIVSDAARIFSDQLNYWGFKGDPKIIAPIITPLTLFK